MANLNKPRKSASKRKGKVVVRQKIEVRSKSKESGKNDTLPRMQARPPADVAPTIRVRLKKK